MEQGRTPELSRNAKRIEQSNQKERQFGYMKRVTDEDGSIRMLDDMGMEIRLSDMDKENKLDHFETLLDIIMESMPDGTRIETNGLEILIYDEDGDQIGFMTYMPRHGQLQINMMSSKVTGGGNAMLLSALLKNPDTDTIYSKLRDDNEAVYRGALKQGKTHAQALRSTPAYKSRALCGYSELTKESLGERVRPVLITQLPAVAKGE